LARRLKSGPLTARDAKLDARCEERRRPVCLDVLAPETTRSWSERIMARLFKPLEGLEIMAMPVNALRPPPT
jgi:hypothetical protein